MSEGDAARSSKRIVGISLVRNEERFVTWALRNVVDFCDELIVLDNGSTDRTAEKLDAVARRYPHVRVHPCGDPNTSQRFLEDYAGRDVWVFGVDGDEVYDPVGLARLRPRILRGEFDAYWRVDGYMLHAVRMELEEGWAEGHINPAAPGGTKLYNFAAIDSWREVRKERLHGRNMVFRPGYSRRLRCELFRREPWESSDFRSLHLCFFPRSSLDAQDPSLRPNPSDLTANGASRVIERAKNFLANPGKASYKNRRYRRGAVVRREVVSFGRPRDHAEFDGQADEAEAVLLPPDR